MSKRTDYISWDSYFMSLAFLASLRSKDPSTRNGACIVSVDTRNVLSLGYNGFPRGCSDDDYPWGRDALDRNDTKYPYVEHAERNAIYNAVRNGINIDGSEMYLYSERGYYPCCDCAKGIIQAGIKAVKMFYTVSNDVDSYSWGPTKRMFQSANVDIVSFDCVEKDFDEIKGDISLIVENCKVWHSKLKQINRKG